MACATLKRSLDLDPVHSPPRPQKRRRCAGVPPSSNDIGSSRREESAFLEASPPFSSDLVTTNIKEEIRRLQRRKQLYGPSSPPRHSGSPSEMGEGMGSPPRESQRPIFTFSQVGLICERMLREREEVLREAYEQVLTTKLAEQYDTFVKFTFDQLTKRFEAAAAPSYLS